MSAPALRSPARLCLGALFAALSACALALALPWAAWADFTVSVAYDYDGAGVYEKAVFTDEEMDALSDGVVYEYATFDSGGWLAKGFGWGVELTDLCAAAGVTSAEVATFDFLTEDGYTTEVAGQWSYAELVQATRYYYPDYVHYYDFDLGELLAGASAALSATRVAVPTIIACESSYARVTSADDAAWDDDTGLSDAAGYRLMYGATSAGSVDAQGFANRMTGVVVRFNGEPSIVFDVSVISGNVGDEVELTATIVAEDEAIAQGGLEALVWESSDASVLSIVGDDGCGTVTVRIEGAGEATLSASFDGVSATLSAEGAAAAEGDGDGDDDGTGDGDGSGTGSDNGSDNGSGGGDGGGSGDGTGSGDGDGDGSDLDDGSTAASASLVADGAQSGAAGTLADADADEADAADADEALSAAEAAQDDAEDDGEDGDADATAAAALSAGGGSDGAGGSGDGAQEKTASVARLALESASLQVETAFPLRAALLALALCLAGFAARAAAGLRARDGFARLRGSGRC